MLIRSGAFRVLFARSPSIDCFLGLVAIPAQYRSTEFFSFYSQIIQGVFRTPIIITCHLLSQPPASAFNLDLIRTQRKWPVTLDNEDEKVMDLYMTHSRLGRRVHCANLSYDGQYLAVGCRDGQAYLYHVQTGVRT